MLGRTNVSLPVCHSGTAPGCPRVDCPCVRFALPGRLARHHTVTVELLEGPASGRGWVVDGGGYVFCGVGLEQCQRVKARGPERRDGVKRRFGDNMPFLIVCGSDVVKAVMEVGELFHEPGRSFVLMNVSDVPALTVAVNGGPGTSDERGETDQQAERLSRCHME